MDGMTTATRQTQHDLAGKTALVTGASQGIGAEIVDALAVAGATVHAVARNADALHRMAARNSAIKPWPADVTDPDFVHELNLRDIDVLINNAGMNNPCRMIEVDPSVLDAMLQLNVRSVFLTAQAAARSMIRRQVAGVIINITSQMGHVGAVNRTVYCMTKHAIEGLTKAMAVELAPHGIRVNSVAPTFVATPMTESMLADRAFRTDVLDRVPLGRLASCADVASAVVFLSSRSARSITGASLLVDGGWTAQ
jgi:NAD(P)-dependent dehydrogenase (short-subunit alcohol dehydrogenase family)